MSDKHLGRGDTAVITGAGSGVGRASALRFAAEGAKVVCADLDVDAAKETVGLVEDAGGTALAVGADVSREDDVVAMLAAVDQFGRLDILFNNVGIPTPRLGMSLEDHTDEDKRRTLFRLWLAMPDSLKLPEGWEHYTGSREPGTVRGGTKGHRYDGHCQRFDAEQAQSMGMRLP